MATPLVSPTSHPQCSKVQISWATTYKKVSTQLPRRSARINALPPPNNILLFFLTPNYWLQTQPAKNNYPHQFNNYGNVFSWANCPPADLEAFYEWPVLRDSPNPWLPGGKTKLGSSEPDRAIFQANGATTVTYCGMITHSGASAAGQFIQCTWDRPWGGRRGSLWAERDRSR